jgi:hypothetical protein
MPYAAKKANEIYQALQRVTGKKSKSGTAPSLDRRLL